MFNYDELQQAQAWAYIQRMAKRFTYDFPNEALSFRGKLIYTSSIGIDLGNYLPLNEESMERGTIDLNRAMVEFHKTYIKTAIPFETRIELSKHETEVAFADKRIHRAKGSVCIDMMANSLMHNTSNSVNIPHKYMAIAGRAYEEAKAVEA